MQPNLKAAFESTLTERIINSVPDMPDHIFSERFEKKMKYIIRHKSTGKVRRIPRGKFIKYIVVAILCAAITACSIEPLREFFKKFFIEIFDTHTLVQSNDYADTPESITEIYEITNIPQGFELTYKDQLSDITTYYVNEYRNNEQFIFFSQSVKSKYQVNVNTENTTMIPIHVNGYEGYLVEMTNKEYCISWDNDIYIFTITGNIDKLSLIKMAESVQKVEK